MDGRRLEKDRAKQGKAVGKVLFSFIMYYQDMLRVIK